MISTLYVLFLIVLITLGMNAIGNKNSINRD